MKNLSPTTLGILFSIIGFSIFPFADVCVKILTETYDPFAIALYANLTTLAFMIPLISYCGGFKKVTATKSLKFHGLRSSFMLINFVCVIYAFSKLPLATAYVILFTMPFILNVLCVIFFNEKISKHRWFAIILGFSGVLVAMRPGLEPISFAMLVIAFGTFFNASGAAIIKRIDKKDHWLSYGFYVMVFQIAVLIVINVFRGNPLLPDFNDWTTMSWLIMAGITYALALSLIPQAMQRVDASIVGALIYIAFPWGIFYDYFIFKDTPDIWTIIGAVIIILSGLYLAQREYSKNKKREH